MLFTVCVLCFYFIFILKGLSFFFKLLFLNSVLIIFLIFFNIYIFFYSFSPFFVLFLKLFLSSFFPYLRVDV